MLADGHRLKEGNKSKENPTPRPKAALSGLSSLGPRTSDRFQQSSPQLPKDFVGVISRY